MKDNVRYVKKSFRMTPTEYELLSERYKAGLESGIYDKQEGFSGFVRENLLERNGGHTNMLRKQMVNLRYELRKIGVNINQVTKKINGGLGGTSDLRMIQSALSDIQELFQEYKEKVNEAWQLQS